MTLPITLTAIYVLTSALIIFQPWFSRRNVLFGVAFGDAGVWDEKTARAIRRRYLLQAVPAAAVIGGLMLVCLLFFTDARVQTAVFVMSLLCMILAVTVFYIDANRRAALFRTTRADPELVSGRPAAEPGLDESRTRLNCRWLLLLFPVLLATLLTALLCYDAMPARLPMHYGFAAADAWMDKSRLASLSPVLMQLLLSALVAVCVFFSRRAPASARGNPNAAPGHYRYRRLLLITLLVFGVLSQLSFLLVEIGFFVGVPVWLFNLLDVLELLSTVAIFYIFFRFARSRRPSGPVPDDDGKWIWGLFYFNRADPSVIVDKRAGNGCTVNFARLSVWIFLLAVAALVALLVLR